VYRGELITFLILQCFVLIRSLLISGLFLPRDLGRADALSPGDKQVEKFLAMATLEAENCAQCLQPLGDYRVQQQSRQLNHNEDKQQEDFDKVVAMFRSVRADANSLSNEERRRRAAEVAIKAAVMLGINEDDDVIRKNMK